MVYSPDKPFENYLTRCFTRYCSRWAFRRTSDSLSRGDTVALEDTQLGHNNRTPQEDDYFAAHEAPALLRAWSSIILDYWEEQRGKGPTHLRIFEYVLQIKGAIEVMQGWLPHGDHMFLKDPTPAEDEKQLAAELGLSHTAVTTRVWRMRAELRTRLDAASAHIGMQERKDC